MSMSDFPQRAYKPDRLDDEEVARRAQVYRQNIQQRRSIRHFSKDAVDASVIDDLIATAASAPSGANKQHWTFCAISDPAIKRRIREAAEEAEKAFYSSRASEAWLKDLEPLGTDWRKPFLEDAPWLIVVFRKSTTIQPDGSQGKNYYVQESVGIACGFLIAAIHQAGLSTLTHTPSPMGFLATILDRPSNE
ncbi:MAG: nitroreductase family protein, partial [Bacteroidetes bacterium]|nr:nitroreductase family protein [Bacteroidota bacterium]